MTYHQTQQIDQALPIQWAPDLPPAPPTIPPAHEASRLLDELRDALDRDPVAARDGVERLARFLRIAGGPQEKSRARGGLAPWQMRKLEVHIEDHLGTPIPIKALADLVSLSCGHFRRAFKESFGTSPHAHIIYRRIARAKELMLTGREPLSQIALICGFADQAHLANLFHRFVGETPSAWRRANAISG